MERFLAVFIARTTEFFRDRATFLWNLLLPVFLIFGFAFAFLGDRPSHKVGQIGVAPANMEFVHYKYLQFVVYPSKDEALKKLIHHQIDMVIDFDSSAYYVNTESQNSIMVEKIFQSDSHKEFKKQTVSGHKIRYVDWFVPGVIGMNIMFSCLFGVGFVIVRYRQNGVLKRFKATPMSAFEFLSAQILSRLFIVLFFAIVTYEGTNLFLHFQMNGSYLNLLLVAFLAILCMISLSLIFAARMKSEETVGGLLNIVIWPMMLLSGIWFSLEGSSKFIQNISQIFPITHFVDASRKIMLDGAGFYEISVNLLALTAMTAVFIVISVLIFKWE